jgi:hypothetical protein
MSDWKVRIPGRHAIGPVSTELLVRGISAGRVPLDAEVSEVGEDAWQPLSSVDEFFEAMGLDDAETRLHEAPMRSGAQANDEDDGDDDAVTRVVESLRGDELDQDDEDDLATRLMNAPSLPTAEPDAEDDDDLDTRLVSVVPMRPEPQARSPASPGFRVPPPPPGVSRSAASDTDRERLPRVPGPSAGVSRHAATTPALRSTPQHAAMQPPGRRPGPDRSDAPNRQPRPAAGRPYDQEHVVTAVAPVESPLMDADEDDEESGSLNAKAKERFPTIRPLATPTRLREEVAPARQKGRSWLHHRVERADELTAPAVRLRRAYVHTRTALLVIMAVLIVALVLLVVLLILRR